MKKLLTATFMAALMAGHARAEDVTLQLKWVTQAQFAGYFVAKDKGFYEEEGLNVTILPGGPDVAPTQVIAGGGADVVIDWMPSALAAREKGLLIIKCGVHRNVIRFLAPLVTTDSQLDEAMDMLGAALADAKA